jgi:hypothetical protein
MNSEALLTVAYAGWFLFTVAVFVAYRVDGRARTSGWRRLAEQRRKQQEAWRMLGTLEADLRHPYAMAELREYLRDDSPHYLNDGDQDLR